MSSLTAKVPVKIGDKIRLKIDRLSYNGGRGVGRFDGGLVVFVSDTAPDELAEVEITAIKKNFAEAQLLQIIEPSPCRRESPCPVAQKCGGCTWQHIHYDEQLRQKEQLLKRNLDLAIKKANRSTAYNFQMIAAPQEFRYRNRVQVHVKNSSFGFYEKNSRNLVAINDCLIAEKALLEHFPKNLDDGTYELSFDGSSQRHIRRIDDSGPAFSQVNTQQNGALQESVLRYMEQISPQPIHLFDFYCGSGNLSFPVLTRFESLAATGVESSPEAVTRAREIAKSSGFQSRAEFIPGDALQYLRKLRQNDASQSVFILDPPRAGLGKKVIFELARVPPRGVILVSCDLGALERDVGLLLDTFTLEEVTAIDMFPQTEYLEIVCLFLPRGAQKLCD